MLNKVLLIGNLTRDPESKDIKENIENVKSGKIKFTSHT